MGKYSKAVFGENNIPLAIIIAGTPTPKRRRAVLQHFSKHGTLTHDFIQFCFVQHKSQRALLIFGAYGGAPTLEIVHLLHDGGCKKLFFIGSAYSNKPHPIGTFLLPEKVIDRAGLVLLDNPQHIFCEPDKTLLHTIETILRRDKHTYEKCTTLCVPCVLHKIPHIKKLSHQHHIVEVEMELSTLYHFAHKARIKTCGLVFVSDNPRVDILDAEEKSTLRQKKLRALSRATEIAKEVLFT